MILPLLLPHKAVLTGNIDTLLLLRFFQNKHHQPVLMLPNAMSAVVTVFMLSLVWNWNDFFSQGFFYMSENTVATFMTQIQSTINASGGVGSQDPTYLYIIIQAGALLCVAPLLIVFAFGQKVFTESIERTGMVG